MKGKRFTALLLASAVLCGAASIPAEATALPHEADYQEAETNFAKLLQYLPQLRLKNDNQRQQRNGGEL